MIITLFRRRAKRALAAAAKFARTRCCACARPAFNARRLLGNVDRLYFDSQPNLYVRGGGCRRSDGIVSEHVCCRRAARTLFAVRHRARRRRRRWTIRSSVALETLAAAGRPIRSPRGCRPSGRLESVCSLLESCPDGRRSCRCRHLAVKLVSKFSCLSNAFALHGTNHPSLTHLLKRFIAMQIPRNMMPSTIMIGSMFSGFV